MSITIKLITKPYALPARGEKMPSGTAKKPKTKQAKGVENRLFNSVKIS